MARREFSVATRRATLDRANGCCECCGKPFGTHPKDRPQFDHRIADKIGGRNDEENCQAICIDCHKVKTRDEDTPRIKKVRREDKRRAGLERTKRKIAYRRFDGTPVCPK